MPKKITKAVIPAAGFGTRFLPWTKAMPKEMLPIVDKPVIQYVVEEVVASGISDIVIVTGANKRAIEDHFDDPTEDLAQNLIKANKGELLAEAKKISELANFIYIRQKGPYGNGSPVLSAEPVIDGEPFVVIWGDEFIYSDPPRLAQMIDAYEKYGGIVMSGMKIDDPTVLSRYGVADISPVEEGVHQVKRIVEKPEVGQAPSNIALLGAYILPPEIFAALKQLKPGKGGEIWLIEAINLLQEQGVPVFAVEVKNAKYYDTGNKLEYLKTMVELALKHEDIGQDFQNFLETLVMKDLKS